MTDQDTKNLENEWDEDEFGGEFEGEFGGEFGDEFGNESDFDLEAELEQQLELPENHTPPLEAKSDQKYQQLAEKLAVSSEVGGSAGSSAFRPSQVAIQRILEDLRQLSGEDMEKFGYAIEVNEDNIFQWTVWLTDFPDDCPLYVDLQKLKSTEKRVQFEVLFPDDYPFAPPFIRVIRPRFKYLTGHITIGGSVCMQVLTRSGWVPTYSLESLLMQIKAEIVDGEARIDFGNPSPYSKMEAEAAFRRVSQRYGWT